MDEDGSEQSGQQDVGCVEITEIIKPVSVIWIWSMSMRSGSGSSGVFSMIPSCLAKKQSAFRLLMEETIPRPVNVSFHASEQYAPKVAMSRLILVFTKWSRLRNCFGMRGGHAAWPKEQDRRSFCAGLTVKCLACNEGAEDLCAQD